LRLLILAKNHLDDAKSSEVSDYLDQRFAEMLKRINTPVILDTEKSLMRYYNRLLMAGLLLQPCTSAEVFEDVCLYEVSQKKLELNNRIILNSVSLNSQFAHDCRNFHGKSYFKMDIYVTPSPASL
jgi:hypothetical protein